MENDSPKEKILNHSRIMITFSITALDQIARDQVAFLYESHL